MKVGVLMGGLSKEREISLKSGRAVAAALKNRGYEVVEIDAQRDLANKLSSERIDVAVIMLHGRWGEDGTMQGMLEILGIPYSGSGPLASAVSLDKELTKRIVFQAGIRTPKWQTVFLKDLKSFGSLSFPLPVIVKPNREGSTIGITIIKEIRNLMPALVEAGKYDETILIEEFIFGKEITVGIVDGRPLPALEIVPKSGFYDFQSKYTKGMTEYIVPARISKEDEKEMIEMTVKVYDLLRLQGIARADFILAEKSYFIEINSIPGMTETSLVPKAAASVGISFEDLCESLVKGASLKI
ncbi:MAG: D-alanine--D-alanine ligase [Deltaproteobacteria bacterium]|nr:D-alanine--D-alanine ligase [Deltaproteobacteria bacterium]